MKCAIGIVPLPRIPRDQFHPKGLPLHQADLGWLYQMKCRHIRAINDEMKISERKEQAILSKFSEGDVDLP